MKKTILYPLIFFAEVLALIVIAKIFDLQTNDSLYGCISACVMFLTIAAFMFKIIQNFQIRYPVVKLLYFPIVLLTVLMIIIWFLPRQ